MEDEKTSWWSNTCTTWVTSSFNSAFTVKITSKHSNTRYVCTTQITSQSSNVVKSKWKWCGTKSEHSNSEREGTVVSSLAVSATNRSLSNDTVSSSWNSANSEVDHVKSSPVRKWASGVRSTIERILSTDSLLHDQKVVTRACAKYIAVIKCSKGKKRHIPDCKGCVSR